MTRVPVRVGIDIGSTTAKVAILGPNNDIRFSAYQRHKAKIDKTLLNILEEARRVLGDIQVSLLVTGSAGMGILGELKEFTPTAPIQIDRQFH